MGNCNLAKKKKEANPLPTFAIALKLILNIGAMFPNMSFFELKALSEKNILKASKN